MNRIAFPRRDRAPIRVAIVEDSPLMQRLLAAALGGQADIEVVGCARDAYEARDLIRAASPDVLTLDVALPGMSGLDFLQRLMELRPMPVVMVSSLTAAGAETSLSALQAGAVDVVEKPRGADGLALFGPLLQAKVRQAAAARPGQARPAPPPGRPPQPVPFPPQPAPAIAARRQLIAMGASTGGVGALTELLSVLPPGLPPIAIVQHMPEGYPERFAARLRASLGLDIAEARSGEALGPGMIRFAPGHRHLRILRRANRLEGELSDEDPVSGHRPSVDVLFESVARAVGGKAMGVILTGMGRDGATGLAAMRRAGAVCLAQGPETSVVYGMPRAAGEAGGVDEEAELPALPGRICHFLNT